LIEDGPRKKECAAKRFALCGFFIVEKGKTKGTFRWFNNKKGCGPEKNNDQRIYFENQKNETFESGSPSSHG
jgi:hypothetical protein